MLQFEGTFKYSVKKVDPFELVCSNIRINDGHIKLATKNFFLPKKIYAVGFGKASLGLTLGLVSKTIDYFASACISVPYGSKKNFDGNIEAISDKIQLFEGAKDNLPDLKSVFATEKILEFIKCIPNKTSSLLVFLISGGGSALFCSPLKPLTVDDQIKIIHDITQRGADITELNTIRSALSNVKGGKLLTYIPSNVEVVSFIISDIVGDPLEYIASGPTVRPKHSNCNKVFQLLEHYKINIPEEAVDNIKLSQARLAEIPENRVTNVLIGNNQIMLNAAANSVIQPPANTENNDKYLMENKKVLIFSDSVVGEARHFGDLLAQLAWYCLNHRMLSLKEAHFELPRELKVQLTKHIKIRNNNNTNSNSENKNSAINRLETYINETIKTVEGCSDNSTTAIYLIFGGETTVTFDKDLKKLAKHSTTLSSHYEQILMNFGNQNLNSMDNAITLPSSSSGLTPEFGKGGRNQEMVLAFLSTMLSLYTSHPELVDKLRNNNLSIQFFSAGSDGQDGPTDAAGAYIGTKELNEILSPCFEVKLRQLSEIALKYLDEHNSYNFFNCFANGKFHFKPGLTGTNVMDMQILAIHL